MMLSMASNTEGTVDYRLIRQLYNHIKLFAGGYTVHEDHFIVQGGIIAIEGLDHLQVERDTFT